MLERRRTMTTHTSSDTSSELRPDIEAAKQKMHARLGSGREIRKLVSYLWDDETVDFMTKGTYGEGIGLLVLTDRRLLFLKEGVFSKKTEDFPIEKISSVQWSSGIIYGTVTVFASGNKAEIKNVYKEDGKHIVEVLRGRLSGKTVHRPGQEEAAATHQPDLYEQLAKLGQLRDAGVLTPEEFDAKKAELLSRM
jgi:PH (Pleckstrin Homology) domain-containing protein/putative oligomerization/nucleic acid binding protein